MRTTTAKAVACVAMAANHLAHAVTWDGATWVACYAAGGVCLPYMVCLMERNLARTRDRGRWCARLLLWGAVAQLPYHLLFPEGGMNVLFVLACCLACVTMWDDGHRACALVLACATHGSSWGVLAPVMALLAHALPLKAPLRHCVAIVAVMGWYAILVSESAPDVLYALVGCAGACALTCLDTGERGRVPGWAFYAFYPAHLAACALFF